MSSQRHHHRSYLLRVWRAVGDDASGWRILLEDVMTQERYIFNNLQGLVAFLEESIGKHLKDSNPITSEEQ